LAVVKQDETNSPLVEHALRPNAHGLPERHRLAVRLADALMTRPGNIDNATVKGLREHFTADQLVELSLKVMKFNIQKTLVALGTHGWISADQIDQIAWNRDGTYVVAP
jgi:hypothetical protein